MRFTNLPARRRTSLIFVFLKLRKYRPVFIERCRTPSVYIEILGDTTIRKPFGQDPGITAHSILLGATERGLGGCMIGNLNREGLRKALDVPEKYEIPLVLTIGRPKETVVIEELEPDGDYHYYRDEEGVYYVPKRGLDDLIVG
ncbi:MAG: nitroreductase family protein [bacterium]|nr:nitroreductase family protein [bacterium]